MAKAASSVNHQGKHDHLIDPSAWISGAAFAVGMATTGADRVSAAAKSGDPALGLIAAAYVAFLATVLLIQRHMRKSMLASTFGSPQHLTTGGIFRYSRNPIYVAFLVPLLSIALLSPVASLAAIILYIVLMNHVVIAREEQELSMIFGQAYADYRGTTPRWLGLPLPRFTTSRVTSGH